MGGPSPRVLAKCLGLAEYTEYKKSTFVEGGKCQFMALILQAL